jgi:hypothetical protein
MIGSGLQGLRRRRCLNQHNGLLVNILSEVLVRNQLDPFCELSLFETRRRALPGELALTWSPHTRNHAVQVASK